MSMERLNIERTAPVFFAETIDSTNTALRTLAAEGAASGTVLVTSAQSAGRGRNGRSFLSEPGGLYLSILLRPTGKNDTLTTLTPTAAVAVCRAIERAAALPCGIKWPNDVVAERRKLCGILTETVWSGAQPSVIIGIGINVNQERFPEELKGIAVSIRELTGAETELKALAAALIEELDAMLAAWQQDSFCALGEYRRRCITRGCDVAVNNEKRAFAQAIGDDFSLIVSYPDGTGEPLHYGEVSVRGLYGYV